MSGMILPVVPAALAATAVSNVDLTPARAGYLSNLSAGAVAQAATAVSNADLTPARAGYLSNLSAGPVAQAATAVSNADYTAARAAKHDYLDTYVSTRAAAATAVSSADYTAPRAAKLDGIIQNSVIQSVQSGTYFNVAVAGASLDTTYLDVVITAVVVAKSVINISGGVLVGGVYGALILARLTSATNLRIHSPQASATLICDWQVVEYK